MIPKGIYPILDIGPLCTEEAAPKTASALLEAGAKLIQLRAKKMDAGPTLALAQTLRALTHQKDAQLIINDRPDIALLCEADGVHLGQDDLPIFAARRFMPPSKMIGLSCHTEAQAAASSLASYIGYGPIFETRSKTNPDRVVGTKALAAICAEHPGPVVAIGGIDLSALPEIKAAGAHAAAMISALLFKDPGQAFESAARIWESS